VLENTKVKLNYNQISSKAVVAQRRCYQDIKNQEIKTPRQDKAEVLALLCLLAWMDLAWKDGRKLCLDWIGKFSSG